MIVTSLVDTPSARAQYHPKDALCQTQYFDETAYLTQAASCTQRSPSRGLRKGLLLSVRSFRAEKSKTRRRTCMEFWMVEPEVRSLRSCRT